MSRTDGLLAPPPGLPDEATLAQMALAFFTGHAAPPHPSAAGGVAIPQAVLPAGLTAPSGAPTSSTPAALPPMGIVGGPPPGSNLVQTSPQSVANAGASIPALVPHALAPSGAPDTVVQAAPGYDGRLGQAALRVPHNDGNWPVVATGSPHFYFLPSPGIDTATVHAAPSPSTPRSSPGLDLHGIRRDFPILSERVNGKPLVWFDNAATTHKPQVVIDRLAHFYAHENSNIHRAAHALAARATDAYEGARDTVRRFIGARSTDEIVFVRGTTEAINLVAKSWGKQHIGAGDEIIVSHLEHHANIVPWQQLAAEVGAHLKVIPVDDDGQVLLGEYRKLLSPRTRIVSVTQVSNALGTIVPVHEIVALAHQAGARTLVDGAQSVSHLPTQVAALDTDFFVFSGHKIFGPTGIGVLYGKREVLDTMPPWQGGGNMIADVTFEKTAFHEPPTRFEAGTGNIADAAGLATALEYVERIGIERIGAYEHGLLDYATHALRPIPGVRLIGTATAKASVLSFVLDGYTTDEVGRALDAEGIAVRTGHHCAQPILRRFGLESTVRPSLAFYNTCDEVDHFIRVIKHLSGQRHRPRL